MLRLLFGFFVIIIGVVVFVRGTASLRSTTLGWDGFWGWDNGLFVVLLLLLFLLLLLSFDLDDERTIVLISVAYTKKDQSTKVFAVVPDWLEDCRL